MKEGCATALRALLREKARELALAALADHYGEDHGREVYEINIPGMDFSGCFDVGHRLRGATGPGLHMAFDYEKLFP